MTERTTCVVVGGGPAGNGPGPAARPRRGRGDRPREARGLPARLPRRHRPPVHPGTARRAGPRRAVRQLPQSRVDQVPSPPATARSASATSAPANVKYTVRRDGAPVGPARPAGRRRGRQEPSFTLRMATEVDRPDPRRRPGTPGCATAPPTATTGEIRADLTVGCDGRWSIVRARGRAALPEYRRAVDAWWFRLLAHADEPVTAQPAGRPGRFAVVIPPQRLLPDRVRRKKGTDAELRPRGIEAFRRDIAELIPGCADRVGELTRWTTSSSSTSGSTGWTVARRGPAVHRRRRARHVTGRGRGHQPRRPGRRRDRDAAGRAAAGRYGHAAALAGVRPRRLLPTILVQELQEFMHAAVVNPIIKGYRMGPPKPVLRIMRRFPQVSYVPAYLIGVGFRPEHAPAFARRQPVG